MNLGAILRGYSMDLADPTSVTWPLEQLLRFHNEGVALLSLPVASRMYKRVVVPIPTCTQVVEPCSCRVIHSVIGICDSQGNVKKILREVSYAEALSFPPKKYTGKAKDYSPKSYAVDRDHNLIYLFDAPPPSYEGYLLVDCVPKRDEVEGYAEEVGMTSDELAIVRQWVLYSAKMVDDTDAAALRIAGEHRATWKELISLYKASETEKKTRGVLE